MHAEMKIGDSLLMLGEGTKFGPMPASLYLAASPLSIKFSVRQGQGTKIGVL